MLVVKLLLLYMVFSSHPAYAKFVVVMWSCHVSRSLLWFPRKKNMALTFTAHKTVTSSVVFLLILSKHVYFKMGVNSYRSLCINWLEKTGQ